MSKCKTVQDEKKIGELVIRKKVEGTVVKMSVSPAAASGTAEESAPRRTE